MTYGQDYGQQGPREQWPPQDGQGAPWQPGKYDPGAHQQRLGQPPQQPHPPQGQPWPQQGYPPPQGPPGWQPPGYGQQPPWGPPPGPPQPPRRKRHTARNVLAVIGGLIVVIIAISVAANGGHTASSTESSATVAANSAAASAPPSSAPPSSAAAQTVTYIVTGSPADVTYGPAGSDLSGSVPMHLTKPLGSPMYYAISAQLQGGGTVSCKIEVDGKVTSQATASGGYNIASCEISQDPLSGNWQDTNTG